MNPPSTKIVMKACGVRKGAFRSLLRRPRIGHDAKNEDEGNHLSTNNKKEIRRILSGLKAVLEHIGEDHDVVLKDFEFRPSIYKDPLSNETGLTIFVVITPKETA